MNRRQVLVGAGAATIALSGLTPWSAFANPVVQPVSMTLFTPFDLGVRGTYSLNGAVSLVGQILPLVPPILPPLASGPTGQDAMVQAASLASPVTASVEPVAAAPQYSAPARAPSMSIVRVPRGSATFH